MQMSVGWLGGISPAKVCSHGAWVYESATLSYAMCRKEPAAFLHYTMFMKEPHVIGSLLHIMQALWYAMHKKEPQVLSSLLCMYYVSMRPGCFGILARTKARCQVCAMRADLGRTVIGSYLFY